MNTMLRILRLMTAQRGLMALAIAMSLVSMLSNIGLMAVSGWFIASMGLAGAAGASMNYFTPAAVIRALAIARTGGRYAERVISHEATFAVLAVLRRWLYDRLEPLAPAHLAEHASGDLLARIRNDIDRLELVFLRILSPVIVAVLTVLVVTVVLARYHGPTALAVLALLLFAVVLLPATLARAGGAPSRGMTETAAAMKRQIVDGLEGLADLKLHGMDAAFARSVSALSARHVTAERRLNVLQSGANAGLGLAANAALLSVLVLVIPAVGGGRVAPADLPMMLLLAVASFDAATPLPLAFQSLSGTIASARRLFDLADTAPAVAEPASPVAMPSGNRLRFERVSLRYSAASRLVLEDIDLDLAESRRVAIVGSSGSGKSSLVNLAVRFADPTQGRTTLGGVPIDGLPTAGLRSRIAVVPQNAHLFAATIRDNLLVARPDATQGQIEAAARTAQLHDFIVAQPKGYETHVGTRGLLLSGGEARRLAIARALLKEAPVLILDEPTEGLDAGTAAALLRGVLAASGDRSILLITHHAAELDLMDEVLVLAAGRIIARGTYRELSLPGGPLHAMKSLIDGPGPGGV